MSRATTAPAGQDPISRPTVSGRSPAPDQQGVPSVPAPDGGPTSILGGTRRRQILAVVIVAISLALAFIHTTSPPNSKRPTAQQSPAYSAPVSHTEDTPASQPYNNNLGRDERLTQLKAAIDSGRVQIRSLESTITNLDSEIERLHGQLTSFNVEIERMEANARSGIEADDVLYKSTIARHNALVPHYNEALEERRQFYSQYEAALAEDRRLVADYNSLIR